MHKDSFPSSEFQGIPKKSTHKEEDELEFDKKKRSNTGFASEMIDGKQNKAVTRSF